VVTDGRGHLLFVPGPPNRLLLALEPAAADLGEVLLLELEVLLFFVQPNLLFEFLPGRLCKRAELLRLLRDEGEPRLCLGQESQRGTG